MTDYIGAIVAATQVAQTAQAGEMMPASHRVFLLIWPIVCCTLLVGVVWVTHWIDTGNWRLIPPRDWQSPSARREILVTKVLGVCILLLLGIGLLVVAYG